MIFLYTYLAGTIITLAMIMALAFFDKDIRRLSVQMWVATSFMWPLVILVGIFVYYLEQRGHKRIK